MTIYIVVLTVYLGSLAVIGMIMSSRSKSAGDFAIGGRSVGPWVTALSFVAAYYSSVVIIGGGAFGWRFGLSTLWVGAGNVLIGTTLAWIILGRRIRRFTENLDAMTLPGFFAGRYGCPSTRIFSAAVTGLFLIVYNVSVLKGMANAFEVLMDLPYWSGVLISGVVFTARDAAHARGLERIEVGHGHADLDGGLGHASGAGRERDVRRERRAERVHPRQHGLRPG